MSAVICITGLSVLLAIMTLNLVDFETCSRITDNNNASLVSELLIERLVYCVLGVALVLAGTRGLLIERPLDVHCPKYYLIRTREC